MKSLLKIFLIIYFLHANVVAQPISNYTTTESSDFQYALVIGKYVQQFHNLYSSVSISSAIAQPNIVDSQADFLTPISERVRTNYLNSNKLLLIFLMALIAGLIAVFTPYVYANIPITISELTFNGKTKQQAKRNVLEYSSYLLIIFIAFGLLISTVVTTTGLNKLGHKWYINLFFFRLYSGLGLSFLGAFDISLPKAWRRAALLKSDINKHSGLFFKALSMPIVTISSILPIVILVLLFAGRAGILGSIIGMLGFSIGLALPYLYPRFMNLMPITVLNQVKVILGILAILLSLKFLSNAAMALHWDILNREVFICICIALLLILAGYMFGAIRLNNDYLHNLNNYGQAYISLTRLFIIILCLSAIIYLLPGLWGAPLTPFNNYFPPIGG